MKSFRDALQEYRGQLVIDLEEVQPKLMNPPSELDIYLGICGTYEAAVNGNGKGDPPCLKVEELYEFKRVRPIALQELARFAGVLATADELCRKTLVELNFRPTNGDEYELQAMISGVQSKLRTIRARGAQLEDTLGTFERRDTLLLNNHRRYGLL
ncbi:MAG TPA: hypothetical protein VJH88_00475 [Candidatus Nanoarchaeia archaeon]|nr:hypothetical protein [Candidatus Nanoarchaeia archaeon]